MPSAGIECGCCLERINEANDEYYNITDEEGDQVCLQCVDEYIVPLFQLALKEINYPPTWRQELVLHPQDFLPEVEAAYGKDFIEKYEEKTKEFATLPALRVYCGQVVDPWVADAATGEEGQTRTAPSYRDPNAIPLTQRAWHMQQRLRPCGNFLRAKPEPVSNSEPASSPEPEPQVAMLSPPPLSPPAEAPPVEAPTAICQSCLGKCWACCGEPIFDTPYAHEATLKSMEKADHVCKTAQSPPNLGTRGVDFQLCPRKYCGRAIALKDGCNDVICLCGEGACFVCGQGGLKDEDDHWNRKADGSGCPKWNLKNAREARARYADE